MADGKATLFEGGGQLYPGVMLRSTYYGVKGDGSFGVLHDLTCMCKDYASNSYVCTVDGAAASKQAYDRAMASVSGSRYWVNVNSLNRDYVDLSVTVSNMRQATEDMRLRSL